MPDTTGRKTPPVAKSPARPDLTVLTVTMEEACARLGCSRSTVYRLWKLGKIERVSINRGKYRVTVRSLNALIKETMTVNVMRPRDTG